MKTNSGYTTDIWAFEGNDSNKHIGVVFVHGKNGRPDRKPNNLFLSDLEQLGYQIVAPVMPWSRRDVYAGTREQGLEVIGAAVRMLHTDKVVVVGHSMGAMAAMQYGAQNPAANVIGVVLIAPGHDPHNVEDTPEFTEVAASRACQRVRLGEAWRFDEYPESNGANQITITATAEYYCSFYSVSEYPDSRLTVQKIKVPAFILAGKEDSLTRMYSMHSMFESMPENPKNRYEELSGKHMSVLTLHAGTVSDWIDMLEGCDYKKNDS